MFVYVVCACVVLSFPLMMNIELPLVEMSTHVSDYCHKVGFLDLFLMPSENYTPKRKTN